MERWFVVFVRTGLEEKSVEILKEKLCPADYSPFVIKKEVRYRKHGDSWTELKILFPGYVIVRTKRSADDVLKDMKPLVGMAGNSLYRVLNYGDKKNNIMIKESEQALWKSLADSDFCVRASEGILTNGELEVVSGPLIGKEDMIKKILKYKEKAVLDVEFCGEILEIPLVLKLLKDKE